MNSRPLPLRLARLPIAAQRPGLGRPLPLPLQRRWLDAVARTLPMPSGVRINRATLGGRPALRCTPTGALPGHAVVWLHGGAYTTGSPVSHRSLGAHLARAAEIETFLPRYRLAPEHPYPAALDDACAAVTELIAAGRRVVLGGDSAGGGLAVAVAQRLAASDRTEPDALILVAPWVDPSERSPKPRDRVVRDNWGVHSCAQYAGDTDPTEPGISPIRGDLSVLPPTLVHIGTEEILRPQVERFVALARDSGADITLREFDWMWHSAHAHAGLFAAARAALDELGVFARERITANRG